MTSAERVAARFAARQAASREPLEWHESPSKEWLFRGVAKFKGPEYWAVTDKGRFHIDALGQVEFSPWKGQGRSDAGHFKFLGAALPPTWQKKPSKWIPGRSRFEEEASDLPAARLDRPRLEEAKAIAQKHLDKLLGVQPEPAPKPVKAPPKPAPRKKGEPGDYTVTVAGSGKRKGKWGSIHAAGCADNVTERRLSPGATQTTYKAPNLKALVKVVSEDLYGEPDTLKLDDFYIAPCAKD